jgi:hypothetical protein
MAGLATLSGRVSRVNPLGYDPISTGRAGLSWLGQDKALRTWANEVGQWVDSWA